MAKTNYTTSALKSRTVRVREVSESIQYGHTASATQRQEGPRFLRITDIQDGKVDWNAVPSCDIVAEDVPKYRLSKGDLVFARTGATTGKSFLIQDCPEAVFASYLIRVRASKDVDPRYLALFFQSPDYWQQIERGKRGIGQPNVNGKILGEIELPLPPLDEQQRIVAEIEKQFTRLDAGVTSLKRIQAALKRYRASVLKAACEGHLVPTEAELARKGNRSYETGEQLLQRILVERRDRWTGKRKYKEPRGPLAIANLPSLPDGWVWASIDQISTKVVDGVHKKPRYVPEGIPFVTVRNLTAGPGISFEKINYITIDDHTEFIKRADPEKGDILVSKDGTLGVIRVINTDAKFSIFVSVAMVKPVVRDMSAFLGIVLSAPQVQIQMVPKGSGLQHIHLEDLREDCIPLPPLAEQRRIVEEVERRLSPIEALQAQITINIQRAARLRQSTLSNAF